MLDWLKKVFGRSRYGISVDTRPAKHGVKVQCSSCGYQDDESKFLEQNRDDTICPKCGEDTMIYDI